MGIGAIGQDFLKNMNSIGNDVAMRKNPEENLFGNPAAAETAGSVANAGGLSVIA